MNTFLSIKLPNALSQNLVLTAFRVGLFIFNWFDCLLKWISSLVLN